jgi:hypothetical protein
VVVSTNLLFLIPSDVTVPLALQKMLGAELRAELCFLNLARNDKDKQRVTNAKTDKNYQNGCK